MRPNFLAGFLLSFIGGSLTQKIFEQTVGAITESESFGITITESESFGAITESVGANSKEQLIGSADENERVDLWEYDPPKSENFCGDDLNHYSSCVHFQVPPTNDTSTLSSRMLRSTPHPSGYTVVDTIYVRSDGVKSLRLASGDTQGYAYARQTGLVGAIGAWVGDGPDFDFRKTGVLVKTIEIWCCNSENGINRGRFYGFRLSYFDGSVSPVVGQQSGDLVSFTFAVGEYLVGKLDQSGNGAGRGTAYIEFKTSKGNTVTFGDRGRGTIYPQEVNGGFLTGAYGYGAGEMYTMGFFLTQPVRYTQLQGFSYPTLTMIQTGLKPQTISSFQSCNNQAGSLPAQHTITKTVGSKNCWNVETTLGYEISTKIEAEVPAIAKGSIKSKWSVSFKGGYENCKETTKTETTEISFSTPPFNRCNYEFTQWNSQLNRLPFAAVNKITFQNNQIVEFPVEGNYEGVYVTSVVQSVNCTPMQTGEQCGTSPQ